MPWWVTGVIREGKRVQPFLRGPYPTEGRALRAQEQLEMAGVEGKITWLKTSDPAKATRIMKERRIEHEGLMEGTKRFRHKPGQWKH